MSYINYPNDPTFCNAFNWSPEHHKIFCEETRARVRTLYCLSFYNYICKGRLPRDVLNIICKILVGKVRFYSYDAPRSSLFDRSAQEFLDIAMSNDTWKLNEFGPSLWDKSLMTVLAWGFKIGDISAFLEVCRDQIRTRRKVVSNAIYGMPDLV